MKVFFLDLWQDLKDKKLLPVAIVLVVAAVAVPVLLLHSAGKPSNSSAGVVGTARPGEPNPTTGGVVTADQQSEAGSSNLEIFGEKDPFQPTGSAAKSPQSGGSSGSASSSTTGPATGGATGAVSASATGGSGAPASSGTGGAGSSGGSSGSGGTSGTSGSGGTSDPQSKTKKSFYTYAVDVKFGRRQSLRTYRDLGRLEMLPNTRNPLLVFMGVTASGKSALFVVDSGLRQSGQGYCRPIPKYCTFLYLKTDRKHDQHTFTDAKGHRYGVKLLAIHRVLEAAARKTAARRARKAAKSHPHAKKTGFALPRLVDLYG